MLEATALQTLNTVPLEALEKFSVEDDTFGEFFPNSVLRWTFSEINNHPSIDSFACKYIIQIEDWMFLGVCVFGILTANYMWRLCVLWSVCENMLFRWRLQRHCWWIKYVIRYSLQTPVRNDFKLTRWNCGSVPCNSRFLLIFQAIEILKLPNDRMTEYTMLPQLAWQIRYVLHERRQTRHVSGDPDFGNNWNSCRVYA